MCGLVGLFGDIDYKGRKAFYIMHHLDVLRGRDGAGIFYVDKKGKGELIKCAGTPDELHWTFSDKFDEKGILKETNLSLILGHNRAQTIGKVCDENAHPFEYDRVVGAHNGTLSKYCLSDFPGYNVDAVDSDILFSGINEMTKGTFEKYPTLQKIINTTFGAMALTWYDKQKKTLHLYRNSQRELYCTMASDDSVFIWASEPWMIDIACSRAGIKIKKIEKYPESQHTQLRLKMKGAFGKVYVSGSEKIEREIISYSYSNKDYEKIWEEAMGGSLPPLPPKNHNHCNHQHRNTVNPNSPKFFEVYGERIGVDEYVNRVKLGCAICGSGISYADRFNIRFLDKVSPICPECLRGPILQFMTSSEIETRTERGKDVY